MKLQKLAAVAAVVLGLGVSTADGKTTADYVQDGLIAMWDGHENDGAGGHAKTLTEWKDTSGTYSFVFCANSGILAEDGALVFPGTQTGYAKLSAADTDATFELAKDGTVEIVILSDPTTVQNVALQSSAQSGIAFGALARGSAGANASLVTYTCSNSTSKPYWPHNWSAAITTYSTTYSSAVPQSMSANAEPLTASGNDYFGTPGDETFLGHRKNLSNGQAFKGRIYAIRLYSAQLTAEQIAANHAVDVARFVNGEYLSSDMLEVVGEPEACGSVTPAYGQMKGLAVGASFTCSAPAAWTNEARMTSYVCTGYTVTTNGAVYLEGTDSSFTYTHPACTAGATLTWKWRKVSQPLPVGYKEVEYIESTGNQYVDLGIVGKTGVSIESKMRWIKAVNDNGYIASRKGSMRIYPVYCYPGKWEVAYNGTHIQSVIAVETANDHTVYSTLSNGCQRLVVDGNEIASNKLTGDYDTGYDLYLFGINQDARLQYGSSSRCYTLLVWMNDELVGNFVPCYTVENGKEVIGLYNVVSKEFCPGVGAGLKRGEEVAHGDGLAVSGEPGDYGTVEPAYGEVTGLAAGTSFVCSATPVWTNEEETVTAICRGYKIYTDEVLSAEGEGTSFTYVHPQSETGSALVWQWEPKYKVDAVTVSGDGSVVVSGDGWFASGETATVTAVPPEGKSFLSWTGEGVDPQHAGDNPYVFTMGSAPVKLTACFAGALYVAVDGDDANDGSSPENAFRTIEKALSAAPAEEDTTIYVGPGTYVATGTAAQADSTVFAVYLDKPVKLISIEGRESTVIDCSTTTTRAGARVAHEKALLEGFTFTNCLHNAKNKPDGLEASAGAISKCAVSIRGQWSRAGCYVRLWGTARGRDIDLLPKSQGGSESSSFVYLYGDSVLDGLTIRGMKYTGTGVGYLAQLEGNAVLRNALIADNEQGSYEVATLKPLVCLNSATCRLEDSTIVNNLIYSQDGAVQVANAKAVVTNTIVYFNSSKNAVSQNIHNGSNKARFFACCSDELTAGENGNVTVDPQFVDAANGNYHLRSLSKAKDMGVVALRPSAATTLECAGDADMYASASGEPLTATFSGYCAGAQGGLSAVWDFGDGTNSTDWPTATHTYETAGAYTVTLTLNDGVSAPAVYTFTRQFVCTPAICYMSTDGSSTFPYDSWEKATPSLQAALDVGSRTIKVSAGTYEIPAPVIGISRAVTLESVEGPEKTTFVSLGGTTCDHRNLNVSASDDIVISGFTFTDGYAANYNWTASIDMAAGTLTNCVFKDIRRVSRSAACYFYGTAKVVDCVFDGHGMTWSNDSNTQSGVRIEGSAVLDRCEIFAFKIENNSDSTGYDGESPVRIASATAVLRNSYVHHCTNGVPTKANVKNRGPVGLVNGRIENCTIVDNVCAGYGGGVWAIGGTVVNSIVWGNVAGLAGNDVYVRSGTTPSFLYSCASDFEAGAAIAGEGCTSRAPNFDEDDSCRLTPLSTACLDTGMALDWMTADSLDKDCMPRVVVNGAVAETGVDMGCFEYQKSTAVPLNGTVDFVGGSSGRIPFSATIEASLVGDEEGLSLVWNFGDGTEPVLGGKSVTHAYERPGIYTVTVHAANGKGEEADIAAGSPAVVVPQICYVSKSGRSIAPYMTWEDAATNIVDAVELDPKTVLVADGLYLIERDIAIRSDVELRSVNGPDVTIVDAQSKCRNVWLTDQAEGAVVDGFTLMRGEGHWNEKSHYARVEAGTLSHCILSNCSTVGYRDAAVLVKGKGRMSDCVVDTGNMVGNADGAHFWGTVVQSGGVIERCTIQRHNYNPNLSGGGGGSHGAVHVEGTGIFRNCLVKDCVTTHSANEGSYRSAVLVSGEGVVENCTIVNSTSCQPGAGLTVVSDSPTVRNTIVWGATLGDGTPTAAVRIVGAATPSITYSCAPELTSGEGNTMADPLFRTRRGVSYQFGSGSPCYNSALRLDWMDETSVDRLGNARVFSVAPDMGCYESMSGGLKLIIR